MNKFLFLLVVLFSTSANAQNIGLKLIYQQKNKIAYIRKLALGREVEAKLIREAKSGKNKFVLEIKNGVSYYHPITGNVFTQNFKIYEKQQSYIILDSDIDMDEPYAAVTDFSTFDWVVDTSKIKNIMGYKCFRAESKDGTIAWFAPKLKYPDGPINFGGLAGVILQIETKSSVITAVEIVSDALVDFRVPHKFQIISLSKLKQRRVLNH